MPLTIDPGMLHREALLMQMDGDRDDAAPAPKSSGIGAAPYVALFGGQGADLATTVAALRNPNLKEGSPLGTGGMVASKAAMLILLPLLMKKLAASGHPTAAKTIGYVGGAAGAVPAAMNLHTMAGAR